MHSSSFTSTLFVLNLAFAGGLAHGHPRPARPGRGWRAENFKTLVTFGDSYTDENRLGYFINNNGSAPSVGWEQPLGLNTASGGLSWARYASLYSNTTLYNYAVSGAVCSNALTPRTFSAINAPFPSIQSYELPAYLADSTYRTPNGSAFFHGAPASTAYAIWIGTNDLGNDAFLTDAQVSGKTLTDYVDCVYAAMDALVAAGARSFVLLNVAPLHLLPQYAPPERGGVNATKFFPNKPANITETHYRMREAVATVNAIFRYRTPFHVAVDGRWGPDVQVADFDVSALMADIWGNPAAYLNGSAPLDVTGVINKCDAQGGNCVEVERERRDSYMWFDELHPSEQTSRVVAREFVGVLEGRSKWARYWG
ncbi:hypothetical protein BDV95DRAFT_625295 [Massariosphaeria phaeospora]|uniref:GDSL lipase/esterase n=1 Tax=Massariosphaeria phaeospora TaxID=100035 RepID=A0A7C8IHL5_9PLEO|nr:hypothetical protein BDV95DRAFT_625295 [Massariosphaeria phaeospora]